MGKCIKFEVLELKTGPRKDMNNRSTKFTLNNYIALTYLNYLNRFPILNISYLKSFCTNALFLCPLENVSVRSLDVFRGYKNGTLM